MLICNKCRGRVFVDTTYSAEEPFCLRCGKRWFFTYGEAAVAIAKSMTSG